MWWQNCKIEDVAISSNPEKPRETERAGGLDRLAPSGRRKSRWKWTLASSALLPLIAVVVLLYSHNRRAPEYITARVDRGASTITPVQNRASAEEFNG